MTDRRTYQERLKGILHPEEPAAAPLPKKEAEAEEVEASCGSFGYLRGLHERADAVEFRFRDGNSIWLSYALLGAWKYNPSQGLLLRFSGDLLYLVLIRGSNLDQPLNEGAINLTQAGLQRHRVVWIREMSEEEIRQVGEKGPTVDSIEVAECESQAAVKEWLGKNAPAFLR